MTDLIDFAERQRNYHNKKNKIINSLKDNDQKFHAIRLHKNTSNLFRDNNNNGKHKLDVRALNQVISVDPVRLIAEVEGMATFSTIVKETLKYHCLPLVVPELKSITIGGALSGVGIEASSFRYGFVHDGVTQFEVLTSDGTVIICTPNNEHSDLFYAFPNSYGTLGYALKVIIKLIPANRFVKLSHYHFTKAEEFFSQLERLCLENHISGKLDFIEGVIFSSSTYILSTGEFIKEAPSVSNYKYTRIYYKSLLQKATDYLTTEDFIWRWDPDWFWCSRVFGMQIPLLRFLLGKWLLKSTAYWKIMRFLNKNRIAKYFYQKKKLSRETVIQDVLIPINKACDFYNFFSKNIGITPIWVCPYMAYNKAKSFNFFPTELNQLYLDFGFWDSVPINGIMGYYNRLIENKVKELHGNKSLYSDAFYPEDEFWQIYDKDYYQKLKQKYDPRGIFNNIYNKCVNNSSI